MKKENKSESRLSIMVSSTVYGIEELLEQIYAMLSGFGYEVWCSHKGTVTVYPHQRPQSNVVISFSVSLRPNMAAAYCQTGLDLRIRNC
jgi:hypothetical protein